MESHETRNVDYFLDSASRSSGEVLDNDGKHLNRNDSRFRYSPETTDYDSNCGDLDSLSGDFNVSNSYTTNYAKYYTSMPILEDGLSSGHASDTENNNPSGISVVMDMRNKSLTETRKSTTPTESDIIYNIENSMLRNAGNFKEEFILNENNLEDVSRYKQIETRDNQPSPNNKIFKNIDPELDSLYSISKVRCTESKKYFFNLNFHQDMVQLTPPPPAPHVHRKPSTVSSSSPSPDVQAALKDIKNTLQRTKTLTNTDEKKMVSDLVSSPSLCSPVWIPRFE